MVLPEKLHDGDLIKLSDRAFVEVINTDGRKALRVTDALGHGVLLDGDSLVLMGEIVAKLDAS